MNGQWLVHCDGSAMPNPGRMGLGAVIVAPDGTRHTLSEATAERGCNNEAELRALMAALREAHALGATAVHVRTDNSIVVAQLGAVAVPPIVRLADRFDEARALLRTFEAVTLTWIPRRRNGEADALARAALGFAPKRVVVRATKHRRAR
ncbi:MAG: ribonuclease HI family protein [Comamonadaceae bacterium]|nr:MAG: ribonuclease HI family protein [Comamonadaceae bacterium]